MKPSILDIMDTEFDIDKINPDEWDFEVWEIKASPKSDALWVKKGELESTLEDFLIDDSLFTWNDSTALISPKTLSIDDLPIKDFEGF